MKYLVLLPLLTLLGACNAQQGATYDADYQRQVDAYDRQAATTDQQLQQTQEQLDLFEAQQNETERQLKKSKEQSDRYDALLGRWEEQADRHDKMLDGVEQILTRQPADTAAKRDK
ncbi:MAG: hypothetical protein HKN47_26475 [Pirellulaceae bacterium]|nr:hypothetical protein [Pirellulaceae bacterium]